MQHDSHGYWKATLSLLTKILIIWFLVSFGAGILFADVLNNIKLGGYPLGFWFAQQGSIYIFIVLILLSMIIFSVTHLLPGSAANLILGEYATAEKIQSLEEKLGLDKPFYLQYWNWVKRIPRGDWGEVPV